MAMMLLLLLLSPACQPRQEPPTGLWLFGEAEALRGFLSELVSLSRTPASRLAQAALSRIEQCPQDFEAFSQTGDVDTLLADLHCLEGNATTPTWLLEAINEGKDQDGSNFYGVFRLQDPDGGSVRQITSAVTWNSGGLQMQLQMPTALPSELLAPPLRPATKSPGARRLADRDILFQSRFKSDGGLDPGTWLQSGGAADRLFQLRGDLFSRLVLEGTWETALYMPEEGDSLPPLVLALELASRRAADFALEEFLEQMEEVWQISPSRAFSLNGAAGQCFDDLRLVPGLAPCYLLTEETLFVGWNQQALEKGLGEPPVASPVAPPPAANSPGGSHFRVFLDRFPQAEERLTQTLRRDLSGPVTTYPWSYLDLQGQQKDGQFVFSLQLASTP